MVHAKGCDSLQVFIVVLQVAWYVINLKLVVRLFLGIVTLLYLIARKSHILDFVVRVI